MQLALITPASDLYPQLLALRDEVLRLPLGLALSQFDFKSDATDYILVAVEDGKVLGCVMLSPKPEQTLKLRQMAVKPGLQGRGIGAKLVAEAEALALREGYSRILLHSRFVATGFYERLGYTRIGRMFDEVGIPHIQMEKCLK